MKKILPIFFSLLLIVVMVVPVSAATADELHIPNPNTVWIDYETYPYAVITQTIADNIYYLHVFKSKPFVEGSYIGDVGGSNSSRVVDDYDFYELKIPEGGYKQYKLNGGLWELQNTSDNSLTIDFSYDQSLYGRILLWTSHDLYYEDGSFHNSHDPNFFPIPLWEVPNSLTTETMKTTLPALGGTMKILTVCGVGLMAFLVVLNLFGKRSLISRG